MEDAGQFDQQVNGAVALSVLHAADMLLACQSQTNRQFLLRNATGSANIVKSFASKYIRFSFRTAGTEPDRRKVKKRAA